MSLGTGAKARFSAISEINTRTHESLIPREMKWPSFNGSEFYGMNTFDIHQMKENYPRMLLKAPLHDETGKN